MIDFIVKFINLIIKGIGVAIGLVVGLLPPSPFALIDNSPIAEFIGGLNWIIPISSMVTILSAWVICIGVYYLVMLVLRWVKAID